MQTFKTDPLLQQQNEQIVARNKARAAQSGGSGLGAGLGMMGSLLGGALGTAVGGPLGGAVGSSLGGSLAGKGDLSGVTPQSIAMGALTSAIGSAVSGAGHAAKTAAEASKASSEALKAGAAGAEAATKAATGTGLQSLNAPLLDVSAGVVDDAGKTVIAGTAAKDPAAWKDFLGDNFLWKKDFAEMASAPGMSGKSALFSKPTSAFELGANKIATYFNPAYKAEGGDVGASLTNFQGGTSSTTPTAKDKNKISDLQKALMLMSPIYAFSQGNPLLGLGLGALAGKADAFACGGKVEH